MDHTVDRIVVVGAGETGARASERLRQLGYSGSLTLVGTEPIAPYERPPLSKAALIDGAEPEPVMVLDRERMASLEIEFLSGATVTRIDRANRRIEVDGDGTVSYDRLLLATGAQARGLPVAGGDRALLLRSHSDALALRRRLTPGASVVVIGAGLIGLEVAAAARLRGCEVTVLEAAPRPLQRGVPAPVAEVIANRHADAGVSIVVGAEVERIAERPGEKYRVELAGHGPIDADAVVAGVGALPNVDLAAAAGLLIDDGIAVDEHLATSDPLIYAAGDCCAAIHPLFGSRRIRLECWRNTHDQARVAAANLLGGSETHLAVPWFWSDQYDLGLQVAGLPHLAETNVARQRDDGVCLWFGLDADGRMVSACGVAPGTGIGSDIRIAERMIAERMKIQSDELADSQMPLRQLLRSYGGST